MLEGTGRLRVGDETLTVPRYGGVLVCPDQLRQVFNDTDAEESRAEPQHYGSLRSPSCCGSANSVNHVVSTSVSDVVRTFSDAPYLSMTRNLQFKPPCPRRRRHADPGVSKFPATWPGWDCLFWTEFCRGSAA